MPTWTTPVDHVTGYVVTATDWVNFFGANGDIAFLYGDTAWTNVSTFTNSWVAAGTTPRFLKTGNLVVMQGQISSGTINTAAFTLPAGYRPSQALAFATTSNGAFGQLGIGTSGAVTPNVGSTTSVSLACVFSVL